MDHRIGPVLIRVMNFKMEYYYKNTSENKITDAYVPIWAKTLIDLYASHLKYEMKYNMRNSDPA